MRRTFPGMLAFGPKSKSGTGHRQDQHEWPQFERSALFFGKAVRHLLCAHGVSTDWRNNMRPAAKGVGHRKAIACRWCLCLGTFAPCERGACEQFQRAEVARAEDASTPSRGRPC